MKKTSLIIIAVGALVVAVAFQFFGLNSKRKGWVAPDLGQLLPTDIDGWVAIDRPIAETEEMQRAVASILSYDSAVFRIYRKGPVEISVYMAYWLPGKVHPTGIDAHTPDVCWVANGWQMESLPAGRPVSVDGRELSVPNLRRFKATSADLSVSYWHVNGDRLRESKSVRVSRLSVAETVSRRVRQVWGDIFRPAEQQIFLRVSCNEDVTSYIESEPVQAGLRILQKSLSGQLLYKTQIK